MKVKILQEKLKKAISYVEKVTGKDLTLPILGNIMLKVENNSMGIAATNLETGVLWETLAKVEEDGAIVLPTQTLSSLIGSLPGPTLTIETQKNSISIIDGKTKTNLNGLSAEEFPVIPFIGDGDFFSVRADLFCQALSCVVGFTGVSSVKPEINGVYMVVGANKIKFVATDSFRLGEKTIPITASNKISKDYAITLPARAAREIIAIFGDISKNINIYLSGNQITIDLFNGADIDEPRIRFFSRLIDGDFPDYQAIIPASYAASAEFSKKEIMGHLKPAGIFAGKNSEVVFNVSIKNKSIKISSHSAELGEYEGELKINSASGKDMSIVFNCRFLIDGLSALKNDECIFEFSGDDGPGLLKFNNETDFIYIIMPIKKY